MTREGCFKAILPPILHVDRCSYRGSRRPFVVSSESDHPKHRRVSEGSLYCNEKSLPFFAVSSFRTTIFCHFFLIVATGEISVKSVILSVKNPSCNVLRLG